LFKVFICRSVRRSLPDYATRRLSTAESDRIERHLAGCPECAAVHHSLRAAVDLAEQARGAPLPPSLTGWSELRAKLPAASGSAPNQRRKLLLPVVAAACALTAFVVWSAVARRLPPLNRNEHGAYSAEVSNSGRGRTGAAHGPGSPADGSTHKRALANGPAYVPALARGSDPRMPTPGPRRQPSGAAGFRQDGAKSNAVASGVSSYRPVVPAQRSPAFTQHPTPEYPNTRIPNTRRPVPDPDLAYLNPDPQISLAQWTHRPADELHRLEADLRQQVRGGDNFVTIPLPQIAGQGPAAVKSAIAAHQKEAEIVDARLVREIGLRIKAMSFADFCAHLTQETGIRFTASRRVADDKITILCHPRSLRSIMRLVAQHFGFSWVRKGEEGAYEYELTQTLRSQLLEEGLRDRDQEEMLLAIDRSMERFRKYRGLSLEQINALKHTKENFSDLFQLQLGGLVPINLYFGLSRTEIDTLRTGQPFKLDLSGRDAALLPPSVVQGIGHSFDESYERESKFAREHGGAQHPRARSEHFIVSLFLDRSKPGEFVLKGDLSDGETGLVPSLAVAKSPAFTVENGRTNAKLAADPDLQRTVTVKPAATCRFERTPYPDTESLYEKAGDKVTTADVLEKLFDAAGIDIIGDYFSHLQDPGSVTLKDQPLFAALNQIGDKMLMRWTKTGSKKDAWLQFRTGTFYYDRPQEIPNRLLERWKALRKRQGLLSLEDLTEIGQLPDAQLDSVWMAQAAIAVYGLDEWQMGRIAQTRPHWRFLGKLSDAQRKDVWTEKGLPYGDLSAELQNQFLSLAYDGDADRPGRHQVRGGSLRVLYAFATHPLQYGGSYAVLISNPLLFVYSATTAEEPDRMAIVGPWNGIYGMRPEMLKPDAFSIIRRE